MSRLMTVADYERELAQLDALIQTERSAAEESPEFSIELSLYSLEQRREQLHRELEEAREVGLPGEEFDIIFKGGPVHQDRLAAEFMGNVLVKLQKLVTSMLAGERPDSAKTGPVKTEIRKASELQFAGSFPGSFGMRLEAIPEQPELDGSTRLGPILQAVVELLQAKDNPELTFDRVAALNARASRDYTEFIAELSKNDAEMRMVWPRISGATEVSLRSGEANRLLDTLRDVRTDSSGKYYWGILDISNSRHGRFGFKTDDSQIFDGVVEDELVGELGHYHLQHCRAWIETKTVTNLRTGMQKKTHRLQEIERTP